MQQLDIFADSRDRILLNTLADALSVAGAAAIAGASQPTDLQPLEAAWAALAAEFPDDAHLAPARLLILALQDEAATADLAWRDAAPAREACARLLHSTAPAAVQVLGHEAATPWLQARWRARAHRARMLPFQADATPSLTDADPSPAPAAEPAPARWPLSDVHPAALWLRACDWQAAAGAVQRIESWRHKPLPLAWMAQATWQLSGPDAAWPLLAELAWRAPRRLPALLHALPDARLHKLARRFAVAAWQDDPIDWAWWPAWLLVEQPLLARLLETAQTSGSPNAAAPERGHTLLQALLRLERQGRHAERVAHRRELQALHPGLFGDYMATR